MPANQTLRQIQQDLDANPPVNVALGSRGYDDAADDLRRLNIGDELQQEFQRIAREAVQGQFRLLEYEPGYKPDDREICWIDLQNVPNVAGIVQRVLRFQEVALFQQNADGFLDDLQYYALFARTAPRRSVVLFRKTSPKLELGRGNKIAAMFQAGHYDKVEETVFLFDRSVDCWTDGRYMFIVNIYNFERIFRYFEELRDRAEATVELVLQRVPVANADEFRAACTTQIRFMTKLAVIASKPYLATIGVADLRRAIREHQLPIEWRRENGVQKLVFDPDPGRRWILLKLLDDDYLNSVMTRLKYEVNSKIAQAVPGKKS